MQICIAAVYDFDFANFCYQHFVCISACKNTFIKIGRVIEVIKISDSFIPIRFYFAVFNALFAALNFVKPYAF